MHHRRPEWLTFESMNPNVKSGGLMKQRIILGIALAFALIGVAKLTTQPALTKGNSDAKYSLSKGNSNAKESLSKGNSDGFGIL